MHTSVTAPARSRSQRPSRASAFHCRCSRASPKARSPRSPTASERSSMPDAPANDAPYRLIDGVTFGDDVRVASFANLYGCSIGDASRIGPFVEIQRGATVGARCKIQSHSFICDGVHIGDEVFVGHGVMFINDKR